MNNSTARVLVCAYACNPFQGSEEGVGWSWLQCLPPSFEKHVLVAAYHQKDIQRLQREQPDKLANIRI